MHLIANAHIIAVAISTFSETLNAKAITFLFFADSPFHTVNICMHQSYWINTKFETKKPIKMVECMNLPAATVNKVTIKIANSLKFILIEICNVLVNCKQTIWS